MSTPSQLGSGLLVKGAPKFTNFVVVPDTWKEKDDTQYQRTDDGDGKPYNYTFWMPGATCSCDWTIKVGQSPAKIGDVVAESTPGTRSFMVLAAESSGFGGPPLKQAVQLVYHEGFTPTVVSGS